MKLVKIALIVVILLLLLLGGTFFFLDSIAKAAIEKGGTYALGVPTHVGSADIGVFRGTFELEGLTVDNPEGFQQEFFVAVAEGRFDLDVGSLTTERIEAPLLELSGIAIALERVSGKTNYGVILEHLEGLQAEEKTPGTASGEEPGAGKAFVIDKIHIRDVSAALHFEKAGVGGGTTVDIDEIVLEDVGEREYTVAELTSLIVRELLEAVLKKSGDLWPDDLAKSLGSTLSDLGSGTIELTGEGLEEAGKALKGLLDK